MGLPKIIAWTLEADAGANLGLFHKLGRTTFLLWPGLVFPYNWQEPG